jgi:hypothetical protein
MSGRMKRICEFCGGLARSLIGITALLWIPLGNVAALPYASAQSAAAIQIAPPASVEETLARAKESVDDFVQFSRYYWEVGYWYRSRAAFIDHTAPDFLKGDVPIRIGPVPKGIDPVRLSLDDSIAVTAQARGAAAHMRMRLYVAACPVVYRRFAEMYDKIAIQSALTRTAMCPTWYPTGKAPPWDERHGIDRSLIAPLQPAVSNRRAALLEDLRHAAVRLPRDPWIVGQRVRFALDQHDTAHAQQAVSDCQAEAWWCALLSGHVAHSHGQLHVADSTFMSATPYRGTLKAVAVTPKSHIHPPSRRTLHAHENRPTSA